jgi:hypothetical protein
VGLLLRLAHGGEDESVECGKTEDAT